MNTAFYAPSLVGLNMRGSQTCSNVDENDKVVRELMAAIQEPESIGGQKRRLKKRLDILAQESKKFGWDGYNASPINNDSLVLASDFLSKYPQNWPMPDVTIDADGEVSFEWNHEEGDSFSVSVGPRGKLNFAGIFGSDGTHGTATFSKYIPETVLSYITNLYKKTE